MGAAANRRGEMALRRPFDDASEIERFIDDSLRMFAAASDCVDRCRCINSTLADISNCRGLRFVFAQARLNSAIGQKRLDKYIKACNRWRIQLPGRREWIAAMDMRKAGEHLMKWVEDK